MSEVTENPELNNKLTLHLGILLTGTSEGKRALCILEGLPRSSFAIGTESWIEHSIALMESYESMGRVTESLFLANDLLSVPIVSQRGTIVERIAILKSRIALVLLKSALQMTQLS
jgi:hypothetical protein